MSKCDTLKNKEQPRKSKNFEHSRNSFLCFGDFNTQDEF